MMPVSATPTNRVAPSTIINNYTENTTIIELWKRLASKIIIDQEFKLPSEPP